MEQLTVAIPTFNRSSRLKISLESLLLQIIGAKNRKNICVIVSNNGSNDGTASVISNAAVEFEEASVKFGSVSYESNRGFGENVFRCFVESKTEYVWFVSDDDNISEGVIDGIFNDISEYSPAVIFYNFDQYPYGRESPLIEKYEYFEKIGSENSRALQKIVSFPKLTSLVIKMNSSALKLTPNDLGFMHVDIALRTGLVEGAVLHSPMYIAYPDKDYMEHIDFPPYVGNNLIPVVKAALKLSGRCDLGCSLIPDRCDPLVSSLNVLSCYYRGKTALTSSLEQELVTTVKHELSSPSFQKLCNIVFLREVLKFAISAMYSLAYKVLTGKSLCRTRG